MAHFSLCRDPRFWSRLGIERDYALHCTSAEATVSCVLSELTSCGSCTRAAARPATPVDGLQAPCWPVCPLSSQPCVAIAPTVPGEAPCWLPVAHPSALVSGLSSSRVKPLFGLCQRKGWMVIDPGGVIVSAPPMNSCLSAWALPLCRVSLFCFVPTQMESAGRPGPAVPPSRPADDQLGVALGAPGAPTTAAARCRPGLAGF